MGVGKLQERAKSRAFGGVRSKQPHNALAGKEKGANFYQKDAKLKRLKMYKEGKPVRDRMGNVIREASFQSSDTPAGRIQPDRRWFGNTRVIDQKQLENFREEISQKVNDPYQVLLRQHKLPMSLLVENTTESKMRLLDVEKYSTTFGPKALRKRPKLATSTLEEMFRQAETKEESYESEKDQDLKNATMQLEPRDLVQDPIFSKGQSKRIWGELYKVIDSSDVLIQVLDARNPPGTRCYHAEEYIKREKPHKHVVFVLNKCDLIPTWVTARWIKVLSREYPTLAFHASINNSYGKGSLIQLLRQFGKLHGDMKQISVGFIGYPNVGKSSIINTLKKKAVCKVAPIPGETKVWQYITLMKRLYLIDCPGVVYPTGDSESDIVLKGVVRVENLRDPEFHIDEVLKRVKPEYIVKTYGVEKWTDCFDFLGQIATRSGKLLKGGEPDIPTVAKMVLNDFIRGRIPFFVPPPPLSEEELAEKTKHAVTPVTQILSKIMVSADWSRADLRDTTASKKPSTGEAGADADGATDQPEDAEVTAAADEAETEEGVIDWDEIFGDAVDEGTGAPPPSAAAPGASAGKRSRADAADDEEKDAAPAGEKAKKARALGEEAYEDYVPFDPTAETAADGDSSASEGEQEDGSDSDDAGSASEDEGAPSGKKAASGAKRPAAGAKKLALTKAVKARATRAQQIMVRAMRKGASPEAAAELAAQQVAESKAQREAAAEEAAKRPAKAGNFYAVANVKNRNRDKVNSVAQKTAIARAHARRR
ncbi:hypothetical protein H696_01804 [Fonticula alba]|uniref:Nucleolar GTP-binding protein 2 n=1 Tax=Fonticula alba TaxID=691883 RepID=A0A058ZER0_FONAL|nr:hypothetical protein H696_01804 [Fonticula alba]KCV72408.1 hypothetical protein H696_01804 [Fonticula alba]|eukprot:XP_009493986.1 hypothetical protein H696_01804 [Fonticula alba]